jgi:hypothetical protein
VGAGAAGSSIKHLGFMSERAARFRHHLAKVWDRPPGRTWQWFSD